MKIFSGQLPTFRDRIDAPVILRAKVKMTKHWQVVNQTLSRKQRTFIVFYTVTAAENNTLCYLVYFNKALLSLKMLPMNFDQN